MLINIGAVNIYVIEKQKTKGNTDIEPEFNG